MTEPIEHSRVSRRIGAITESATLAVDAKAKALKAAGRPVIGFGAGEPDFPTPAAIVEAAAAACYDPRWHRYSPAGGLPELRSAIATKTLRDSGLHIGADQVLVTNGGKQALYNAFATLLDPGDEVLLPAPYWTTYPEAIQLAGGVPVVIQTTAADGYRTNVAALEAALTPRTKILLFVSPSNPTGAVYRPERVAEIGRWAADRGLWVITDEIYEHLVYGDAVFSSLPVLVPEIADRCVVVNGVAKTYAMTGWRVGWLIGPKDVVTAATNLQSHATSNVANVSQIAALAAVSGDDANGLRPPTHGVGVRAERHRRCRVSGARGRVLRVPVGRGCARPRDRRSHTAHLGRARRAHPRRSGSRGRAGRGVRCARIPTLVLRARRRRPSRRCRPHRPPAFLMNVPCVRIGDPNRVIMNVQEVSLPPG
jgi:aspartate aminotransferase